MSQPIMQLKREEYDLRIARVQERMREKGIDLLVSHACECESATVRYLTNFWAVFDFVGCEDLEFSGFTVVNSNSWTCCFTGCRNLAVRDLASALREVHRRMEGARQ